MTRLVLASALAACVLVAPAAPALAADPPTRATTGWRFVTVDHPDAEGQSYLTSLRADGRAVGAYADAAGRYHGMLRLPDGRFRTIDVPGATSTFTLGIAADGTTTGTYVDAAGAQHGYVRTTAGQVRTIDVPQASATSGGLSEFGPGLGTAVATISPHGAIVGTWGDAAGASHGFLLAPSGKRTDLDAPGASTAQDANHGEGGTNAIRANARGQVVGSFVPAGATSPLGLRAYVKTGTSYRTLLPPGAGRSQAFAITNDGTVGGVAFDASGLPGYGFLWRRGHYTRIDPHAGAIVSTIADIAPNGTITGEYITPDGHTHGYIGTPRRR